MIKQVILCMCHLRKKFKWRKETRLNNKARKV